jgi:glycogen operon protein
VLALRRAEPALHHDRWFQHVPAAAGERSVVWLAPTGHDMQVHDWHDGSQHAFACRIDAAPRRPHAGDTGATGEGCRHLLIAFNPEPQPVSFVLPQGRWEPALDTSGALPPLAPLKPLMVCAHTLVMLRGHDPADTP